MEKQIAQAAAIVFSGMREEQLTEEERVLANLLAKAGYLRPSANGCLGTATDKATGARKKRSLQIKEFSVALGGASMWPFPLSNRQSE